MPDTGCSFPFYQAVRHLVGRLTCFVRCDLKLPVTEVVTSGRQVLCGARTV